MSTPRGEVRIVAQQRHHVYEADVVRVLTFACVIAVHTISHTQPTNDVGSNGVEMLLHFTREAFFCLTGFVLMHQTLGRPLVARTFWRRRILAVGVPYAAWTLIYTGLQSTAGFGSWGGEIEHLAKNLLYGTAWYHLYFLLVSMQIYLLFPLIAPLIRRTAGHHAFLLGVSGALQLALLTVQMYEPPHAGWLGQFTNHQDALIFSYQFYVLLGAVAAFHLDRLRELITTYRRGIVIAVVVLAVATECWYVVAEHTGTLPVDASAVLQPAMLPWSVAAVAGLFLIGSSYSEHRRAGSRLDRALTLGSDRSFGVFLVHPAVLWFLLQGQTRWLPEFRGAGLTVIAYILVVVGSLGLTELFRRSPLSLALTGRPALPTKGREDNDVRDHADTPGAPGKATYQRHHDGDRQRAADPLLQ